MADFNEILIDPRNFYVASPVSVDNGTVLTQPKFFDNQNVKYMTVADGGVLKVYDITNPAAPVLVETIG